ncbi:sterol desaturase family protein [uncultured Abyssibacter sp.]|uniref:sterol desaturase family protein n=1 Tax=uncultured Abyssibacter sp. TaxID=2320202 RepID=UPI0032B25D6D
MESLILLALAPVFYGCMLWEALYWRRRGVAMYTWRDTLSNISLAGMHQVADGLAWLVLLGLYTLVYQFRLLDLQTGAWTIAALFIAQDFFYYWFHRVSHGMRWMWASHVTHHSSERLNLSTAFRQSLTYPISGMWVFWLPLAWIGFEPHWVVLVVGINLAYQFFVHTQAVHKLHPAIEFVFNTPSHHRVHHARNECYVDRNFGGVLILWDRLFGTFVEERDDEPCVYGITRRQIRTHNPITLTFQEWAYMFRQASRDGLTWGQRLRYLWGHPDWEAPGAATQSNRPEIQTTGQPVSTLNKPA